MTARASVLDLLPSSRPRNPELPALMDERPAADSAAPSNESPAATTASTTLSRVPVDEEVRPRRIRISIHVTADRHYLVRKGAAELNMSVDSFLAAAVDAALRGLSLLE